MEIPDRTGKDRPVKGMFITMPFRILLAAAALAALLCPAVAAEATECDRLAASPNDPGRLAAGVPFNKLDGPAAETACRAALAATPDAARLKFQLGRAFDRQDRFADARETYQAAFASGYAIASSAYGKLLELGLGGPVDFAGAAAAYQRALDAGYKYAAGDLAYLHEEGLGFPAKDPAGALPLYRIAAEAGDTWSDVHLGFLYERGNGGPVDFGEAVKWYRAAADRDDPLGQADLGVMYESGKGVAKDTKEALRLFRLAAGQDNALALRRLAAFYRKGTEVAKDDAEAERLLRKAVEAGEGEMVWQAQNELAWLLALGNRNLDEAATLIEEVLPKVPSDHADKPSVLDTAAWIDHLRGRNEEAATSERAAIAIDAGYAPFHDRLGDIYAALGRRDDARAEWQKALSLPLPDADREPDWDRDRVARKLQST